MSAGSVLRVRLLVLARHGQSLFNVSGVVNGDPARGRGLPDVGRAAAEVLLVELGRGVDVAGVDRGGLVDDSGAQIEGR